MTATSTPRWRGSIGLEVPGEYTFQTRSDDGSMLYIDREIVVDNDGVHGKRPVAGSIELSAGPHDITITFFENRGGAALEVSYTPTPGAALARLSPDVLSNRFGCPCHGGLFFEAFAPPHPGACGPGVTLAF